MSKAQKGRLLIVDDTPTNLRFLMKILSKHGYAVASTTDGESALQFVHATPPELILLDIFMPGMNGYEVCQRLKADETTRDIPIIFISSADQALDKVQAFAVGGVDYIVKPFHPEEVLARIQTHLALRKLQTNLEERVEERLAELSKANAALSQEIAERKSIEAALRQAHQDYAVLVDSIDGIVWEADAQTFQFTFVSNKAERLLGFSIERWVSEATFWRDHIHQEDREWATNFCVTATNEQRDHDFEYRMVAVDDRTVWLQDIVNVVVEKDKPVKLRGIMVDITERKKAEALRDAQSRVLEMIAISAPLEDILTSLIYFIESQAEGMLGSVLLLDEEGKHLRHGAAPSLSQAYNRAIDGVAIGPQVGSCGTAAFRGEPVMVTDILHDPLWTDFRDLAMQHGLRACWSTPILSYQDKVLGTFAMYYREPRSPIPYETQLIAIATHIAGIAIERQQSEAKLRESEQRFRTLVENAPEALVVLDLKSGHFVDTNEKAVQLFGLPREALLNLGPIELSPQTQPDGRASTEAAMEHIRKAAEGETPVFEWAHRNALGKDIPCEVRLVRLPSHGRRLIRGSIIDITERKCAEEELQRSAQEISDLYHNAPCGYHALNKDGTFIRINQTELDWLGYASDEVIGKMNIAHLIAPESLDDFQESFSRLKQQGALSDMEFEIVRKDGSTMPVLLNATAIKDSTGNLLMINSTLFDLTERKRLEDQFRQSQKMEAVGRLAGGIAHDFNNLLTAILGYSQLALRQLDPSEVLHNQIQEIRKAAERAALLTSQLLAFSRRQVLQPKILNLNLVIEEMDNMLRRLIGEDIDLRTHLEPRLAHVKADPGQLTQVIMNLAVNARDAMPQGGKLTIETQNVDLDQEYAHSHLAVQAGEYVMLSVSDSGQGIAEEHLSFIFEPFFTTKEKGKGTGLGLSTIYGIIKQSGGSIWVYSELGQGTNFKIYLPRVEEKPAVSEERFVDSAIDRGKETILLVEDEEIVRSLATTILQRSGYTVLEANCGAEALLQGERHTEPIHLLVTDVVMPEMNGRELAERLMPLRPNLKVLFMSGYIEDEITQRGILELGAAFLQKPFTPDQLLEKVRQMLDAERPESYQFMRN